MGLRVFDEEQQVWIVGTQPCVLCGMETAETNAKQKPQCPRCRRLLENAPPFVVDALRAAWKRDRRLTRESFRLLTTSGKCGCFECIGTWTDEIARISGQTF